MSRPARGISRARATSAARASSWRLCTSRASNTACRAHHWPCTYDIDWLVIVGAPCLWGPSKLFRFCIIVVQT